MASIANILTALSALTATGGNVCLCDDGEELRLDMTSNLSNMYYSSNLSNANIKAHVEYDMYQYLSNVAIYPSIDGWARTTATGIAPDIEECLVGSFKPVLVIEP